MCYAKRMLGTRDSAQKPEIRIGIDLGGTKIEAMAIDRAGQVRFRERIPTPQNDYDGTVRATIALARAAQQGAGATEATIGIGIPGAISPATGLIKGANSVCLIGHALDKDIAAGLGAPVRMANDADCFALSEACDGAGRDGHIVFGVILGTGVGGGLVVGKSIVRGPNAITGEWGHNPLPWPADDERPGRPCYCGRRGCIETFLSGPSVTAEYEGISGETASATDIAVRDDAAARGVMDRYVDRLARGLASLINTIDPSVIVLGGGLSKIERLYSDVAPLLPKYVFSDIVATPIVPPRHGDSSGVRGAAWLWP